MVNFASLIQQYAVVDFLLPFLLVFVIVFAVLQRTNLLGKDRKNFNVVISLILGLLFVIPHITGAYPLSYDPVDVVNQAIPSISLVAIASIMLLLLLGIFGGDFAKSAMPFIAIAAIGFVVYIFGSALKWWKGPYDVFYWWTTQVTEVLIIILVFGLIVWFITREPGGKTPGGDMIKNFGKLFEKK
ncbi:MAG: hypothetical protein CMH61_00625 [Nanoarchaeota archaeon]|nr:hypothetical protein [Nanoarchaeota archaeon]|tara:strand:+ start:3972 stop:4529 length:558 start_codon:yes stop_codon:yes gene_type:complete